MTSPETLTRDGRVGSKYKPFRASYRATQPALDGRHKMPQKVLDEAVCGAVSYQQVIIDR